MFALWDGFTDYLHGFLFGIYPYICAGIFFIGSLIRFDRDQYTWRSGSSQMLRARQLRWGSNLFHFGILFLFLGHFVGLLTPHALYEAAPPLKTLEYLANGLPTVATNTAGNSLYIQHGQNGLLVADDVHSFAKGIVRLADAPELRHELSRRARAAAEPYDWRRHTLDRLLPVFEELVGEHSDKHRRHVQDLQEHSL